MVDYKHRAKFWKWYRRRFRREKILCHKKAFNTLILILINRKIIKPDCACKIDVKPFFSYSYAIYFNAAVHLSYLFLCWLSKLYAAKSELCGKFRMYHWRRKYVFIFSCVTFPIWLLNVLKISTSSTIKKIKRLRSAPWTEKKSFVHYWLISTFLTDVLFRSWKMQVKTKRKK